MASANKNVVQIMGHLGQDPEFHTSPTTGKEVATLSVATNENQKQQDGTWKSVHTEWHRVKCFGWVVDEIRNLRKGAAVFVEGHLRTNEWTTPEGVKRYSTEIIARQCNELVYVKQGGGRRDFGPVDRGEPAHNPPPVAVDDDDDDLGEPLNSAAGGGMSPGD
jgi:single-strand DNA-binding protein